VPAEKPLSSELEDESQAPPVPATLLRAAVMAGSAPVSMVRASDKALGSSELPHAEQKRLGCEMAVSQTGHWFVGT
jgi:hypothetical protein